MWRNGQQISAYRQLALAESGNIGGVSVMAQSWAAVAAGGYNGWHVAAASAVASISSALAAAWRNCQ